jgi:hypothetical protein
MRLKDAASPPPEPSPEHPTFLPPAPDADRFDPAVDSQENVRLFYIVHLFKWFERHRPKVDDLEACPIAIRDWNEAKDRVEADLVLFREATAALATMEQGQQARRARQIWREPRETRKVASLGTFWAGKLLAQGAIGRVWQSVDKRSGKLVAVKTIEKSQLPRENLQSVRVKLFEELKIHCSLKHANVIELLEYREYPTQLLFALDFAQGGDLLSYLRDHGALGEDLTRTMYAQLVNGLKFLHNVHFVVHRDVKPENLLFAENNVLKLADFGVAAYDRPRDRPFTELCGTPSYMSPELISGRSYTGRPVDIWASGVVLFAMLRGTLPFKGSDLVTLRTVICGPLNFSGSGLTAEVQDLLGGVLQQDPRRRWSIDDVAACDWMLRRGRSTSVGPQGRPAGVRPGRSAADLSSRPSWSTDTTAAYTMGSLTGLEERAPREITPEPIGGNGGATSTPAAIAG